MSRFNLAKFQQLREKAGFTPNELSVRMGLPRNTVGYWERGERTPKLTFLQTYKLCTLLNCELKELI